MMLAICAFSSMCFTMCSTVALCGRQCCWFFCSTFFFSFHSLIFLSIYFSLCYYSHNLNKFVSLFNVLCCKLALINYLQGLYLCCILAHLVLFSNNPFNDAVYAFYHRYEY